MFNEEDEYGLIYRDLSECIEGEFSYNERIKENFIDHEIKEFNLNERKFRVGKEKIISYYELSFEPVKDNIIGELY